MQSALKICQRRKDCSVSPDYWDWEGDLTEEEETALLGRAEDNNEQEEG